MRLGTLTRILGILALVAAPAAAWAQQSTPPPPSSSQPRHEGIGIGLKGGPLFSTIKQASGANGFSNRRRADSFVDCNSSGAGYGCANNHSRRFLSALVGHECGAERAHHERTGHRYSKDQTLARSFSGLNLLQRDYRPCR